MYSEPMRQTWRLSVGRATSKISILVSPVASAENPWQVAEVIGEATPGAAQAPTTVRTVLGRDGNVTVGGFLRNSEWLARLAADAF
jgi:hypothetical protein